MEYTILTSNLPSKLIKKVNLEIKKGFEPVGSHKVVTTLVTKRLSVSVSELQYSQTMIKRN